MAKIALQDDEALGAKDESYRIFFRTSRDPIFITSKEGRWIDFNDAAVELFGYENRDELRGVRMSELYEDPEERERHTHIVEQQGFTKDYPVNLRKKDGSIINTLITSVARKDVNGDVMGYQGTIRDITECKQAEEALKKSQDCFCSIVEKSTDGAIITDLEGVVQFVNPALASMFGRTAEELSGELFGFPIMVGESTEIDIIPHDGKRGVAEMRVAETEWGGERAHLAMIRNITERKRAEEELKRKNAELLRLNSELDDYVRFVSHDVRAPLRHIKALSLFINEDYGDKLDGNGKEYIRKITTTCDGAEAMINELLVLAKMKDKELVREEVNLEDVTKEIETGLESFLEENNGRIEVDESLPSLLAHRAWMKELFLNLIMNGVKHNDKEEKVVRIGFEDGEDTLLFFVADNGIGIEDKYSAEIFRPFKRVNVKVEGTGLGLSLCKKVVELHDGKIWVESEIDKGSTFFFSFPKNTRTGGRV